MMATCVQGIAGSWCDTTVTMVTLRIQLLPHHISLTSSFRCDIMCCSRLIGGRSSWERDGVSADRQGNGRDMKALDGVTLGATMCKFLHHTLSSGVGDRVAMASPLCWAMST